MQRFAALAVAWLLWGCVSSLSAGQGGRSGVPAGLPNPGTREALSPRDATEKHLASKLDVSGKGRKPLQPGDIVGTVVPELPPPPPPGRAKSDFDQLRDTVCSADAVVRGQGAMTRVFLTKSETFLVTTYNFRVDSWLRIRSSVPRQERILVALQGGEALWDKKKTVAMSDSQIKPGTDTVLWLKRVPSTDAYELSGQVGVLTFENGGSKTSLPTSIALFHQPDTKTQTLTAISNAAATCGGAE